MENSLAERKSCPESSALKLLHVLAHQTSALDTLMKLIQLEGHTHQKTTPQSQYDFRNDLFSRVVGEIIEDGSLKLIDHFVSNYIEYRDVQYFTLQNITSIINSQLNTAYKKHEDIGVAFVNNTYCLLRQVTMATSKAAASNAVYLVGDPTGTTRQQAHNVCSVEKHSQVFTSCWLSFLQLLLPSKLHKEVLLSLHSLVMPRMTKPHLLVDYLVGSYDQGGVYSILALNGLFILMHHYHLDYPHFYQKLYTLLQPSVFHVKYMPRFFKLLNVFLSSTHLPLYLVAAFAKKIARLSLSAPPQGIMIASVLVVNLIRRHPNCRVLLHRNISDVFEIDSDPFQMEERDPAKCAALESCLWELKTLQNHYHPAVAGLITRLLDPEKQSKEEPLHSYLQTTAKELFEKECQAVDDVPLNYSCPDILWGDTCIS